ncbi:transposase [Asaia sp. VD9]|uniref:transposase n=1 Tax=Asaia sp. VD9 TaxID=3081235 RepID=UPI00301888AF
MDELGLHKGPGVRAVTEAAGASLRFLPSYSPDFNPIEMAFSRLKAHRRRAAERTRKGLGNKVGSLIDQVTTDKCANFFTAAGYEPEREENTLGITFQKRALFFARKSRDGHLLRTVTNRATI